MAGNLAHIAERAAAGKVAAWTWAKGIQTPWPQVEVVEGDHYRMSCGRGLTDLLATGARIPDYFETGFPSCLFDGGTAFQFRLRQHLGPHSTRKVSEKLCRYREADNQT